LMITSVYAAFEAIWPEASSGDHDLYGGVLPPTKPQQEHTSTVM